MPIAGEVQRGRGAEHRLFEALADERQVGRWASSSLAQQFVPHGDAAVLVQRHLRRGRRPRAAASAAAAPSTSPSCRACRSCGRGRRPWCRRGSPRPCWCRWPPLAASARLRCGSRKKRASRKPCSVSESCSCRCRLLPRLAHALDELARHRPARAVEGRPALVLDGPHERLAVQRRERRLEFEAALEVAGRTPRTAPARVRTAPPSPKNASSRSCSLRGNPDIRCCTDPVRPPSPPRPARRRARSARGPVAPAMQALAHDFVAGSLQQHPEAQTGHARSSRHRAAASTASAVTMS
jgi:hypothetical protein